VTLYVTILICSVGAATQGWDQTGSNGANLSFPAEFSLAGTERGEWLVGVSRGGVQRFGASGLTFGPQLINAAPYIASAVFGCWLSDPLNNFFGRRGTIFITALILIATPIASGFTHSWQTLFVVRLILGIGMGAKGATVPIFAAENSPTTIRGALVMSWQLWTAFGVSCTAPRRKRSARAPKSCADLTP
jgi:MFS family permease